MILGIVYNFSQYDQDVIVCSGFQYSYYISEKGASSLPSFNITVKLTLKQTFNEELRNPKSEAFISALN